MSQSNFEQFASRPEYRALTERVSRWLASHQRSTLDPRVLAREWPEVRSDQLAIALQLLVRAGILRRVYKVLTPTGVLVDEEFDDPSKIPERLPDRSNSYFETADSDIVPVFKQQGA